MPGVFLFIALLAALGSPSSAQSLPDLQHQDAWTEQDKKAFLDYVESGKTAPVKGSVRRTEAQEAKEADEESTHMARYLTASLQNNMMFTNSGGKLTEQSNNAGLRLLAGEHLFSWVRAYSGLEYSGYAQQKLNGSTADLSHLRIPVGLELALIPLGTPHTRYVILRAGASLHRFWGDGASDSDFQTSLLGWEESWDLGLGYEWQISNTPWRWHVVAEGEKAWSGRFYSASLAAGLVRTF